MPRPLMPWLAAAIILIGIPVGASDGSGEPEPYADGLKGQALHQEHLDLAAVQRHAAFQQTREIVQPDGAGRVLAFHPLADGGLVIATGAGQHYGEASMVGAVASLFGFSGAKPKARPAHLLVWLDPAGERLRSAPLPFAAMGLTVAPDGAVIAVGDDDVVVFSAAGEPVAHAEAPHVDLSDDELATLREELAEQYREQAASRQQQYERIVRGKADLEQVPEDERTPRQKAELARATMLERSYKAMLARTDESAEAAVNAGLAKARTIHRVAASRDHLFLVAREPAGNGYGIWRCGRDFTAPEKIVDGLRGCCGQMDVQVIGDELVVAENARHHVAVYSFDGEPLRTFGKASRRDIREGFGGCCNPMNACAGPDGTLLLSESNGLVKQFTPDGTLTEILGIANVRSGCKNSSIGLSTDGSRLYYLDIQTGRVLVLEKRT